ncbi:putative pentatricopeptide repeat-containing protein At3g11460, mitochondrial [Camellia sinensis]|uniref:putative pentatricopeptide repeat-containing protein At3g11460, mitochondrial n=1 Tax=Camellia sinensis TaxID=4442 RepID=UPI001036D916|nr:putative pentatricopeptide repeat-containing protein At3g11460, mitochondrial [Camellia sinensis]
MDYARKLFDLIPERDLFLWNTMIRGYADLGPCQEAIVLYRDMHRIGLLPDSYTFPSVVRSCAILSALMEGREAHCNIIKNGFDLDILAIGAEVEQVEAGKKMIAFGTQLNAITLVSILPACAGLEFLNLGKLVHGCAVKLGVDSDIFLINTLIALYGECGIVDTARSLFDQMPVERLVSWNAMIAAYEQTNADRYAIKLFRRMLIEKVEFDYITMVSVISACANLGALNTGKWIHKLVRNKGLETNVSITNALIDMYAKCGNIALARDAFDKLPHKSVVSWTSIIGACASHGHGDNALMLFTKMKEEEIWPNSFTFISVSTACRHSGLVEEGKKHFESMTKDYSIRTAKVVQISCGWRHTLAFTKRQNVFSWRRGTNGQLGHGESVDRNIPKMIESLSADGSSGQQIESSKLDPSTGKALVSPIERYAVVPDDNVKRINFAKGKI